MRSPGLALGGLLLLATSAAAQPPLVTIAPANQPGDRLGPRTVVPAIVACTDLPAAAPPTSTLRIVAPHVGDSHLASYRGHIVVLNGGTPQGLSVGQRYFTRRIQPAVYGVTEGPAARSSVRTTGWLTVIAADEQSALAQVDYACDAVDAGDYLEPYVAPVLPATLGPGGPTNFANLGQVLFGTDRRQQYAAGDFLNIDRGSTSGLAPGARVAFYRDRRNGTPLVPLGVGIVVEVAAGTAKVVVQRSSEAIALGDYYGLMR